MTAEMILRLVVAAHALYIPLAAVSRPWSLQASYVQAEGLVAWFFMALLAAVASMITVDVAINRRTRIRWAWVTRHRRHLYLCTALVAIIPAFSASRHRYLSDDTLFFYGIIVVSALCMCFLDDRAKREGTRCSK